MKQTRFVILSDTHCLHHKLTIPDGDFLIHAGDFSHKGRQNECIDFLKWFEAQPHKYRVFCCGNHELGVEQSPDIFARMVKELAPSCHYLYHEPIELGGWKLFASPYTPRFFNWAFNVPRGEEIRYYWNQIPENCEILISHGPPRGILDLVLDGSHQGCDDLKWTIENRLNNLQLHCYGHLHLEGAQSIVHNGVIYVNAACVGEDYKVRGSIQVVDLFKS